MFETSYGSCFTATEDGRAGTVEDCRCINMHDANANEQAKTRTDDAIQRK
jgi:hypothetical protein